MLGWRRGWRQRRNGSWTPVRAHLHRTLISLHAHLRPPCPPPPLKAPSSYVLHSHLLLSPSTPYSPLPVVAELASSIATCNALRETAAEAADRLTQAEKERGAADQAAAAAKLAHTQTQEQLNSAQVAAAAARAEADSTSQKLGKREASLAEATAREAQALKRLEETQVRDVD